MPSENCHGPILKGICWINSFGPWCYEYKTPSFVLSTRVQGFQRERASLAPVATSLSIFFFYNSEYNHIFYYRILQMIYFLLIHWDSCLAYEWAELTLHSIFIHSTNILNSYYMLSIMDITLSFKILNVTVFHWSFFFQLFLLVGG